MDGDVRPWKICAAFVEYSADLSGVAAWSGRIVEGSREDFGSSIGTFPKLVAASFYKAQGLPSVRHQPANGHSHDGILEDANRPWSSHGTCGSVQYALANVFIHWS